MDKGGHGSKSEILRFFFLTNYQQKYMEPLFIVKGFCCDNSVRVWGIAHFNHLGEGLLEVEHGTVWRQATSSSLREPIHSTEP